MSFTLGSTIRLPDLPFDAAATATSDGKNTVVAANGTSVTLTARVDTQVERSRAAAPIPPALVTWRAGCCRRRAAHNP